MQFTRPLPKPAGEWMKGPKTYLSGGFLSDVFDVLGTGAYGIAGLAHGAIEKQPLGKSFVEGIKHRASWRDVLSEHVERPLTPGQRTAQKVVGTGLDILLDPGWLVPPLKASAIAKAAKPLKATYEAAKGVKAIKPLAQGAEGLVRAGAERLAKMGFQTTEEMRRLKAIRKGVRVELQPVNNAVSDFVGEASRMSLPEREVIGQLIDAGAPALKEVPKATRAAAVARPGESVARIGLRVRPLDRNNIGTIVSVDAERSEARVYFHNPKDNTTATKAFALDQLRDAKGNPIVMPTVGAAPVAAPTAEAKAAELRAIERMRRGKATKSVVTPAAPPTEAARVGAPDLKAQEYQEAETRAMRMARALESDPFSAGAFAERAKAEAIKSLYGKGDRAYADQLLIRAKRLWAEYHPKGEAPFDLWDKKAQQSIAEAEALFADIASGKRKPQVVGTKSVLVTEQPLIEQAAPTEPWQMTRAQFTKQAVQRIEEPKVGRATVDKPHGVYTTPLEYESPHKDLGGRTYLWLRNPDAKVLEVDASRLIRTNRGLVGQSAGIGALRQLVGQEEAARLLQMPKADVIAYLSQKYPKVAWNRYYDTQEALEGYAGLLAREAGYDAIFALDKNYPELTEYVGLTEKALRPVASHEEAVKGALAEGRPVPPEVLAEYPDLAATTAKSPLSSGELAVPRSGRSSVSEDARRRLREILHTTEGVTAPGKAARPAAGEGLPFAGKAATEGATTAKKPRSVREALRKQPGLSGVGEAPSMAAPRGVGGIEVGVSKALRKPGATIEVPGLSVGETGKKVAGAVEEFVPEARPATTAAKVETEMRRVRQDAQAVAKARSAILQKAAAKGMDPDKLQKAMFKAINLDNRLGRLLVDSNLMSKETFDVWQGGHLRRLYMMFENPEEYVKAIKDTSPLLAAEIQSALERIAPFRQGSKPAKGAKAVYTREEIDAARRAGMGEVNDVAYRMGRQGVITLGAVQKKKVLDKVAEAFAVEVKPGMDPLQMGLRIFPNEPTAWGPLAGKAVPAAIYHDLNYFARKPEGWQQLSSKLVGAWKYGKVILNPGTWGRNIMSNFLLADAIAGLPIYRVDIYAEALKDLATKSGLWDEARNATTLLENTFTQHELGPVMNALLQAKSPAQGFRAASTRLLGVAQRTAGGLAQGYQFVEQWGKMAVYRYARSQGKTIEEAAKLAEKALFDYGDVPRWVDMLRSGRLGPVTVPFLTFSSKAIPAVTEAALKNPARVTRWAKTMAGVESLAGKPGENAQQRAVLPDYVQKGQWVRLPIKDANGDNLWLDMTYILPMNDLNEASGILGTGAQPGFMSLPFIDAFGDLTRNVSRFSGRPIWKAGSTKSEISKAVVTYITDFLAPPLAGKNLRTIIGAWRKIPDWNGRQQSLASALAGSFAGLKTRSFDINDEYISRVREVQRKIADTRTHLRSVLSDPRLSEERKQKVWQDALKQIETYVEALNVLVGEAPALKSVPAVTGAPRTTGVSIEAIERLRQKKKASGN